MSRPARYLVATVAMLFAWMMLSGWDTDTTEARAWSAGMAAFMLLLAVGLVAPRRMRVALRIAAGIVALGYLAYFLVEVAALLRGEGQTLAVGRPSALMAGVGLLVIGLPAFIFAAGDTTVGWVDRLLHRARGGLAPSPHPSADVTVYLREADFVPLRTWELVRWCHQRGASDFSFRDMGIVGHDDPVVARALADLAPFRLDDAMRSPVSVFSGEPDIALLKRWRLCDESILVLERHLPDGLFTPPTHDASGWLEDPVFYRDATMMLGVVSHEGEGYLHLRRDELDAARASGFVPHESGLHIR